MSTKNKVADLDTKHKGCQIGSFDYAVNTRGVIFTALRAKALIIAMTDTQQYVM